MSGKEGFTAKQIQQLTKAIYSLNNNGKNDKFVSTVGLLAHNTSTNSVFTKLLCRFYSTWLRFVGLGYGEDDWLG